MLLCRMKWNFDHLTLLVGASTLAMAGLVIFQYKWINHSQELYHEVFHQRACMALCSTLEEYGEGAICNDPSCASLCTPAPGDAENSKNSGLIENQFFQNDLRRTLDFYNIDMPYKIAQSPHEPLPDERAGTATCVVNVPPDAEDEAGSFIILDFPEKQTFLLDKMKFMIGASMIILLFTAFVLLLANWWLLKQKRLLQTNVEMYNNMAHEFRTPLTNIQLASTLLAKDPGTTSNNKFLDIITRENGKLIHQVERILHLARLDNGAYALQNEKVHLKTLLQTVLDEFEMQIEERKAIVRLSDISNSLEIRGDKQHLSNVFRNLIDNALKYAADHPVISISAVAEDEQVMISIQDNGIGIPPSQSRLIFEKFQRVHQGDRHEQKGFGLGLAYVKKIVELHKGTIHVDSEVNKGSLFRVYLPKFC